MSSACANMMEVKASDADLLKLKTLFKNGFCLDAIKPMPPEIASGNDRREWLRQYWGTGGDVFQSGDEKMDPFEPTITFYTKWTPPIEALKELTRQFSEISIKFNYYNHECEEAGQYHIEKGIATGRYYIQEHEEVRKIAKEIHGDDFFDDEDEE